MMGYFFEEEQKIKKIEGIKKRNFWISNIKCIGHLHINKIRTSRYNGGKWLKTILTSVLSRSFSLKQFNPAHFHFLPNAPKNFTCLFSV